LITEREKPAALAIGLGRRLLLILVAWITALVISCPDPRGFALLLFFPLGLPFFIRKCTGLPVSDNLFLGWMIYVSVMIAVAVCQRIPWFLLFYTLLVVLLFMNVAGCFLMGQEPHSLH
jgi:hypothetical protein